MQASRVEGIDVGVNSVEQTVETLLRRQEQMEANFNTFLKSNKLFQVERINRRQLNLIQKVLNPKTLALINE